MAWQSPISPGKSWYEATVPGRPSYPAMDGSRQTTVAIIGGGFTGLQAALNLARHGIDVTLIEAHRFGDGASGRNGGQIGTGQRWWPEEAEAELGLERSRALFAMSENAKRHLLDFARNHAIDIDFMPGHLAVSHKPSYESDFRENARILAERYDYPHVRFMEREETVERTGSSFYHFGSRDAGTGHIHPMKLVVGLARVAAASGAALFEQTPATDLRTVEGKVIITTPKGTITAEKVLLACNGHIGNLERTTARHVMPIRSFIGATRVLHDHPEIIPGGESVADSRFVVRYFRKSKDGRLLFGGREAYTADNPSDMDGPIRRQIAELYPALANIEIDYAWGGSVGITMSRRPYVKEVMPNVMSVGGYSGHGVMLSNYCGKLYADMVAGKANELEMLKDMKIPAFPGGPAFRPLLLFVALSWYALRDRF